MLGLKDDDYIIAADSGLYSCIKFGIIPDLAVGDFDSYTDTFPEGLKRVKLPVHKDDTDLLYAVKTGISQGFKDYIIIGGYGSRADQSFAMLQTLKYLATEGCAESIRAVCVGFDICVFSDSVFMFTPEKDITFSVFSLSDKSEGVFINGGEYGLDDASVSDTFPIGVSNRAVEGKEVTVSVKHGTLAVYILKEQM